MGADLLISICEWPVDTEGNCIPASKELGDLVAARFIEESIKRSEYEFEDYGFYLDEEGWAELPDELVAEIKALFSSAWHRETCTVTLKGTEYLVTGGMSYGDDPTDYYRIISILNDWNVTSRAF